MSKSKSDAQRIAENAGYAGHNPPVIELPTSADTPRIDPAEVVARFQIETDTALATIRREHQSQIVGLERRVAALQDEWTTTRGEIVQLKRSIEDALHQMRAGIAEAINAQKEAVKAATTAANSAAVFEKLKASQPDFHRMVEAQNKQVAGVVDRMTHVEERLGGYAKRLDELDAVAEDYEDTKGAVRGIDHIVKDLNQEARQRRQIAGKGA